MSGIRRWRTCLRRSRAEASRAGLAAHVDLAARMNEAIFSPLIAELELAVGGRDEALAETNRAAGSAYREALSVAAAQGARTSALLAALALAKLLRSTGEAPEAHAVLAPVRKVSRLRRCFRLIAAAQALMERSA